MENGLKTRRIYTSVQDANVRSRKTEAVRTCSAPCVTTTGAGSVAFQLGKANNGCSFVTFFACFTLKLHSGQDLVGKDFYSH